jgi:hypothetical protein
MKSALSLDEISAGKQSIGQLLNRALRRIQSWDWLESTLTVDELRLLLPETRELPIVRYELPKLGAVNFLIRGLLGTGATSSLRLDAQAKALGEWLRARSTKVPKSLVTEDHR